MSELRGWHLLPEQHLHPDALVAYVDGELTEAAAARAAAHVRTCLSCNAEVCAQRQARGAVRRAEVPAPPANLLAALRSIPTDVELPSGPDGLAMTADGELVSVQQGGQQPPIGGSTPLGSGSAVLGRSRFGRGRRSAQGAVVSGLMVGALALSVPMFAGPAERTETGEQQRRAPAPAVQPADPGRGLGVVARVQRPNKQPGEAARQQRGEQRPVGSVQVARDGR